jgi:serine phosphatase RsbU (regulator of sigma subunit)/tetratricopeptide (TPR) repeat protein
MPYLHPVMRFVLLFLLLVVTTFSYSQKLFPELTKKINNLESPALETKVEGLYATNLKKNPKKEIELKLWKFYIYDSLDVDGKADTLAMNLEGKIDNSNYLISSKIYLRLGNLQTDLNEFKKGISLFHSGLKIAIRLRDKKSIGAFKRAIGTGYLKLDQHKTAEKYLRESYAIYKGINDSLGIANSTISLGNALKEQERYQEAIKYYELSLDLAEKLGNKRLIAGNFNNLGNIERRLKHPKKALDYFFKALEMNEKSNNKLWQSFNYHNIGMTYQDMKLYNESILNFKKSNDLKIELGDSLSLVTGYRGISDVYAKLQDYKNAYVFLKLHVDLKDTLNLAEQANLLKDLEAKYESEKKEAEIDHLKTQKELQEVKNDSLEMKAQKNRNLLTLAFLAGLILLAGIGVLYRSNKSRRKANDLLNSKNEEIESSNVALQSALTELSEKNREIIDSINYATYIQRATLPNITKQSSDYLQFELIFAPKDIVSGDFYFSYHLYNRSIFGVADCTGHGVPGAMVSLVGMNSLEKVVRETNHTTTGQMVESLNQHVVESLDHGSATVNDGMDVSFCELDHENNMLRFTGANHSAYIIRHNSLVDEAILNENIHLKLHIDSHSLLCLNGTRRPIGRSISQEPFSQVSIKLMKGDRIVLFSDGYADQIGGENAKKLKKGALLEFLIRSSELKVSEQSEFMKEQFDKWKGNLEQVDDVCMLFVEVKR